MPETWKSSKKNIHNKKYLKNIYVSYISRKGSVRKENQDAVLFKNISSDIILGILCDGMGGHYGGKHAANEVINFLSSKFNDFIQKCKNYKKNSESVTNWLYKEIRKVQNHLEYIGNHNYKYRDMGTTIVLVLIIKSRAYIYHAGDSRVYYVDDNRNMIQLTLDHNVTNYSRNINIKNQFINNALVHGLGPNKFSQEKSLIYSIQSFDLPKKRYLFLLCSDGLYSFIKEREMFRILSSEIKPEIKTKNLFEKAVEAHSNDNISCLIIEYKDGWK